MIAASKGKYTNVLVFSQDSKRSSTTTTAVTIAFAQLNPRGTYRIKEYRIDATRSNYLPTFYADVGGLAGLQNNMDLDSNGNRIISEYAVSAIAGANDATKQIWTANFRKYQSKADLENTDTRIITASSTGTYSRSVSLTPNSVVFYELIPASPVPSITSPL